MRHILIAAASLAIGGVLVSTSAHAQVLNQYQYQYQMAFEAGGPTQRGGMCQVFTDDFGNASYGYLGPCPNASQPVARAVKRTKK